MTVPDFPRKTWRDVPQGTVPDGSVPRVTAADLTARDAALGAARDELNGRLSEVSLTGTFVRRIDMELLDNGDFEADGGWSGLAAGSRTLETVTDGPGGTTRVLRIVKVSALVSQQVPDISARGLDDRTIRIQFTARAVPDGVSETFTRGRVRVIDQDGAVLIDRQQIKPNADWLTWSGFTQDIEVPADTTSLTLYLGVAHTTGTGSIEYDNVSMKALTADVDVTGAVEAEITARQLLSKPEADATYLTPATVGDAVADEIASRDLIDKPTADTSYTPFDATKEQMLLQEARAAKGGAIGVGQRGVVAFRFDDWHDAFNTTVIPLLKARGVPAGHATISDLSSQPWASTATPEMLRSWHNHGIEFWSHGLDHLDPTPHGYQGLLDQIVGSKATIESWGVKCQGWMHPGATPVTEAKPYSFYNDLSDMWTPAGLLIRQTYPLSEAYISGTFRGIPHGNYHGQDHFTLTEGATVVQAKERIDLAIARRMGVELMTHSGNLGKPNNITVAEFTEILDYVVAAWDRGDIEVLTPSGLFFADKTADRMDLVKDGGFEQADEIGGSGWSGAAGTIHVDGGRTGSNFLRIAGTGLVSQRATFLGGRKWLGGETFLFEGWARSAGTGTTTARVILQDYDDNARLNLNLTSPGVSAAGWTRVRHAFSLHPDTGRLTIALARNFGDSIDWDDVSVRKV